MRGSVLYDPSSFRNQKHYFVLDTPRFVSVPSSRFNGLLKNATSFRAKPSTLNAVRKASCRHLDWKTSLEVTERTYLHPNHALRALASQEVIPATSPRRISGKLNALRGQLASAPASLQGHLHSGCYEALFKSGDLTTSHHRGKLDARAPSLRSGTAPHTPKSALTMMVQQESASDTDHNSPVYVHSKLYINSARPRKTRPSTAATAAAAAAEAAETRKKLRSAPATLYSDYYLREFQNLSGCGHCIPAPGKIHHGSTFKQQRDFATQLPLTLEDDQRRARPPIKSVAFHCKQTSSPYNCKMSNRAKKTKSYTELNYTGVTGRSGIPLDVQLMEFKAKNSIKNASEFERPVKKSSISSDLQDAFKIASTLDVLGDEFGAQQDWCGRLARSLKQQQDMLRLIKRNKGRRAFTCDNIMCEVSQFERLGNGYQPRRSS